MTSNGLGGGPSESAERSDTGGAWPGTAGLENGTSAPTTPPPPETGKDGDKPADPCKC